MNPVARVASILAGAAILGALAPAAAAGSGVIAHMTFAGAAGPTAITASPAPCSDSKFNLIGPHWTTSMQWRYKSATTPSYLTTAAVVQTLKRGVTNITQARNDCGRTDKVSATQSYLGTTTRAFGVTKAGTCGTADGGNTFGFGSLPAGVLAITCVRSIGSRFVEADIRFTNTVTWALSSAGCSGDFMLEAVTTHEAGHAFGLDHVSERTHGRLTMSTFIDGACQNSESTLGAGDLAGLESMY